jgi:hypothetical protein
VRSCRINCSFANELPSAHFQKEEKEKDQDGSQLGLLKKIKMTEEEEAEIAQFFSGLKKRHAQEKQDEVSPLLSSFLSLFFCLLSSPFVFFPLFSSLNEMSLRRRMSLPYIDKYRVVFDLAHVQ